MSASSSDPPNGPPAATSPGPKTAPKATGGGDPVDRLITLLARLPGLGPRSARRIAVHLLTRRERVLLPLAEALATAGDQIQSCEICGSLDITSPCGICADPKRDPGLLCVVRDVADVWALERSGAFAGRYHVLGGVLSAMDGVGPEELRLDALDARIRSSGITEVILALPATMDGQTTAHVIADRLEALGPDHSVKVTGLGRGVPLGGELEFMDDGTLGAALKSRSPV
ncbi:MAG: recombination mediator RecR [Rhodospirillaceae bacterium]